MAKMKYYPHNEAVTVVSWLTPTRENIRILTVKGVKHEYAIWTCAHCNARYAVPLGMQSPALGGIQEMSRKQLPVHPLPNDVLVAGELGYTVFGKGGASEVKPVRLLAVVDPDSYVCPVCAEGEYA